MTLKAISIGVNSFQNLVETDRSLVDSLAGAIAGVILGSGTTMISITDLQVTPGAGHTVNVGAGKALVREKTTPLVRGAYFFQADAIEASVALPVPDTQPFYAAVVARVTDPQYGTVTGNVGARIDVIKGTPAASPVVVPDATIDAVTNTPGGWIRLADVRINTGDTGAIPSGQFTDTRKPGGFGEIRCLRINRPASPLVGTSIYEMDTKMKRTWDGTRWRWSGGAMQIRAINLPLVNSAASAYVTFPVLAGSGIAAHTDDPDSAMSIVTTAGSQGIKCEVAGIYRATIVVTSSANSTNALATIFIGSEVAYGPGIFGPSGATMVVSQPIIANVGDLIIPKIYTYSGTQTYIGKMFVELLSEK